MPPRFDTSVYTVGWVCASKDEVTASRAFLDEEHEQPPRRPNDNNVYIVGAMGEHKVVIAFPGAGSYGADVIAHTVAHMVRTFQDIRFGLMNPLNDIRLGDVVVIEPNGKHSSHNNQGGVLQYDKGRWGEDGVFEIRSHLKRPPKDLLAAMNLLKSDHDRGMGKMIDYFEDISRNSSRLDYRLYKPSHPHTEGFDCSGCGTEHLETRLDRESDNPAVHYGLIASANAVMRSAVYRDHLRDTWGVCCFEMEAAGLMNYFPCLIVRGIADYSDNHKNDHWQRYAAAMAAAYAKDLLRVIPPEDVGSTEITSRTNEDCMSKYTCYQRLAS
ncbi:purine and uridine phosphorylase [Aspergillus niger ATCC 13496]|uniref:Purine and uridine phosphorylase n=1 Tax=Aspergillus niger ATCC 13496 TaxID=1353008 RepID=A0A370C007_ASPNG|nr:purine and uridine phosphorylase [Aspergillus niger ATCC 13496]